MSPFPQLATRRKSLSILDLMVVSAISALLPATFQDSGAVGSDGGPLAVFLLTSGYVLWWLLGLAATERRRWLDAIVLPVYIALSLVYIFAAFITVLFAPLVALLVIAVHGLVGIYPAFRP